MIYNLRDSHKKLASWLVEEYREGNLPEEFELNIHPAQQIRNDERAVDVNLPSSIFAVTGFEALASEKLIIFNTNLDLRRYAYRCGLLQKLFIAVDTNFGELEMDLEPRSRRI